MKQSASGDADSHPSGQEIIHLLRIPKFHYDISIHIPASGVHFIFSHSTYLTLLIMTSFYLQLGVKSGLFPSGFLTKILFAILIFSQRRRHPCFAHINILKR